MFKPMLSGKAERDKIQFPVLASPKLDGIRLLVMNGAAMSRSLKPLPNKFVQACLGRPEFEGFDGEIVVGPANAPDVYRRTNSAVMSIEGEFEFSYMVFDRHDRPDLPFRERLPPVTYEGEGFRVETLQHTRIHNLEELSAYQAQALGDGYEGVMIRDQEGPYKMGRSTVKEGWLLKMKAFDDAEAEVIGVQEEMANMNEATTDALGHTKRSSHKENKVGKGRMGALIVRGLNGPYEGVEFNIGTGFDTADREADWPVGEVVTYKYFAHGALSRPRHPVFLRRRAREEVVA